MIDPAVIAQFASAWAAGQEPNRESYVDLLPSREIFKTFVEQAFFASLEEEEGRPTVFAAAFGSARDADRIRTHARFETNRLATPLAFNVTTVAKLAPALDPQQSAMAVDWDEAQQALRIWGIHGYRRDTHFYNSLPITVEGGAYMRPDLPTLSTPARGSLTFSRGDALIGRFSQGQFVPASPTVLNSKSLGKILHDAFRRTTYFEMHGERYVYFGWRTVDVLMSEVMHRSHGATVVFLDALRPHSNDLEHHYCLQDQQLLPERIERFIRSESDPNLSSSLGTKKVAFESLQRVAQLSSVDGALILDTQFHVHSFGSKLRAPRWPGSTIVGPDGFGNPNGGPFDITRYGTRHRSALDFSGANPGSIVFVVSQDKFVRAFTRSQDAVLCWPDCTTSMFVT
jgi:hypothetical protein